MKHVLARNSIPIALAALQLFSIQGLDAQEAEQPGKQQPIGQFVTVMSPIQDEIYNRISTIALKLQHQAVQEDRPAILVLEILPGTSPFHHVQGLTKFLTSAQISNVTTVAWVPSTLTGPNVLVALACQQIVMHPDAELGDISRGKVLEPEEQQAVLALAQKRHNPKINSAIVRGMMNQQEQLWRVRVRNTDATKDELESRVVTKEELETFRKTNVTIESAEIVKDAGTLGSFRGSTARSLDIIVTQTAETRTGVAALYGLQREALREPTSDKENQKVRLIKLEGIIDRVQETFLMRQIDRAVADGSQAIVFQIDSPGGYLQESIDLANAIASLQAKKIRTIAYIEHEAISGAAIVSLGCDEIYMHPDAKIGDAGPIQIQKGQMFERAPEKILSILTVALKSLAEKKQRPVALCEAMADRSMKVFRVTHRDRGQIWYMTELEIHAANGEWIQGAQLRETNGELLFTADGTRAHELKIAEAPVNDIEDLKSRIGVPAGMKFVPIEKTWVDNLVFTLNLRPVIVLMIVLGVALIYLELHFMTGFLGILSVICFALFFWANYMGGSAGWLEVLLFLLGIACLALEIFVVPGFGVFGVSGILLILVSLIMAGHSWSYDAATDIEGLTMQSGRVLLAFSIVIGFGVALARFLPSIPGFESMVLGPPGQGEDEPKLRPIDTPVPTGLAEEIALGEKGLALTILRPAGKARFENRVIDVISEGPFIQADTQLEVVSVTGNRVVVRQV